MVIEFLTVLQSPTDAGSTFALEPGDLLMDFTEATPLVNYFILNRWELDFKGEWHKSFWEMLLQMLFLL